MALDLSGGQAETISGSQVIVWCGGRDLSVAGLSLAERAIYTACRAGFEKVLIVAERDVEALRRSLARDPHLAGRRWEIVDPKGFVAEVAPSSGRWVVTTDEWVIGWELLAALWGLEEDVAAASAEGPVVAGADRIVDWVAAGWRPGSPPPAPVTRWVEKPGVYVRVRSPQDVPAAEEALVQSLARNITNFFARTIDRPMSRAISRRLARTRVTPNQITVFSVGIGVLGSLLLVVPSYLCGVLGAFLFFASTVIDGCDGEIARLKFEESEVGARLDVIGDNVVHAFLFPCVALGAYLADPAGPYLWLGAISFAGVVATWIVLYFLILKREPSPRMQAVFEAFANREFAYLFLLLALAGKLHWFVWAMAFGLWAFPLALVGLWLVSRGRATPA